MNNMIVNADDFGYSRAINYGIADAHVNGIVTSTTLMANMPAVEHAISLAKQMPELGVGVHLTMTCGRPLLTEGIESLTDSDGNFYSLKVYETIKSDLDKEELYREWKAQIQKLLNMGVTLTHIDSHHHVHSFEENKEVTKRLSDEFHLPVRNCKKEADDRNFNFVDLFNYPPIRDMSIDYESNRDLFFSIIEEELQTIKNYKTTEVMCHPAYVGSRILENSSFNIPRVREVDLLCDPKMKDLINKYEIKLINYRDI